MLYQENQKKFNAECSAFELSGSTTVGGRLDQQDCIGFHLNQNSGIIVLCDGMGGYNGGAAASLSAAEHFLKSYEYFSPEESEIDFLGRVIQESNTIVKNITDSSGNFLKCGTTAVSLIISERKLYWCSVGDSRAYLWRNGEFVQFTLDQNYKTVLEENMRAGTIDEEDYMRESEKAESLISFIGIQNLGLVDYNDAPLELEADDRIIIMSDGLYKTVSDEEISALLENFTSISDAVDVIEAKAEKNAGKRSLNRDNTTFAVIKIR